MGKESRNKRKNRRKYQNKVTKKLCIALIINAIVYLIFSQKLLNLDIEVVTNIITSIKDIINFDYSTDLYSLINFGLIAFSAMKILLIGRRIPFVLIFALFIMIKLDSSLVKIFGDYGSSIQMLLDKYQFTDMITKYFKEYEYGVENFNYAITMFMPVYLFFKRAFFDTFVICIEKAIRNLTKSGKKQKTATTSQNKGKIHYYSEDDFNSNSGSSNHYIDDEYDDYYNRDEYQGL